MTEPVHKLGELLRTAREARGVDLARVERETKIREHYLAALESGDYRDLPGAVYTRGFLRNYGEYLGLDPDELIDLYRLETSATPLDRQAGVLRAGRPVPAGRGHERGDPALVGRDRGHRACNADTTASHRASRRAAWRNASAISRINSGNGVSAAPARATTPSRTPVSGTWSFSRR